MRFTRRLRQISVEGYVGTFGVIIASIALVFSIVQIQQQQRHNERTVNPILTITNAKSIGDERFVGLILNNKGVGPAIVGRLHLYVDGQLVPIDGPFGGWFETLKLLCPDDYVGALCVDLTGTLEQRKLQAYVIREFDVLSSGESRQIFGVRQEEYGDDLRNAIVAALSERLIVAVCYESVYGETYVVESRISERDLDPECPNVY